jgi:hypothetical protein
MASEPVTACASCGGAHTQPWRARQTKRGFGAAGVRCLGARARAPPPPASQTRSRGRCRGGARGTGRRGSGLRRRVVASAWLQSRSAQRGVKGQGQSRFSRRAHAADARSNRTVHACRARRALACTRAPSARRRVVLGAPQTHSPSDKLACAAARARCAAPRRTRLAAPAWRARPPAGPARPGCAPRPRAGARPTRARTRCGCTPRRRAHTPRDAHPSRCVRVRECAVSERVCGGVAAQARRGACASDTHVDVSCDRVRRAAAAAQRETLRRAAASMTADATAVGRRRAEGATVWRGCGAAGKAR